MDKHKEKTHPKPNLNRKVIGANWLNFKNDLPKCTTLTKQIRENESSYYMLKNIESKSNLTKCLAMDCEMVGIGINGLNHMLARVSIVNEHLEIVLDKYVKPREKVMDYRTQVSGIRPKDIEMGSEFSAVQKEVSSILKNKILVGHALKNDLEVLFFNHPKHLIRDTARYHYLRRHFNASRTPSLKHLAKTVLKIDIQIAEHDSVEDARAAMQIYIKYKQQWEQDVNNSRKRYN